LIINRFLRRLSRSVIGADAEDDFGISAPILEKPSHVLAPPPTFSFVALPTLESDSKKLKEEACSGAEAEAEVEVSGFWSKLNMFENPFNPLSCLVSPVEDPPLPEPPKDIEGPGLG